MSRDIKAFIDSLVTFRLLSSDQVAAVLHAMPGTEAPDSADALAKTLVERKKLTQYQAERLLEGKGRGLVYGNYQVLQKLGEGGMGVVYLARHHRMHRIVALKVLIANAIHSPEAVTRFHREVAVAANLVHPNIVRAYDADEDDDRHFLVMEFVDGQNLAQIVKQDGPIKLPLALSCMHQAASGLAYAHSKGVVHRDIKPHNLLLDKEEKISILDMGLARIQRGGGMDSGTTGLDMRTISQTGAMMGTVHFMAPEQAEDIKTADHRADIYSLGCTMYYILTGQFVYAGDNAIKIILAHRDASIPSLQALCADAPAGVERIYRRMVAKNPRDRYQTMRDVMDELEHCGVRFNRRLDLGAPVIESPRRSEDIFHDAATSRTQAPPPPPRPPSSFASAPPTVSAQTPRVEPPIISKPSVSPPASAAKSMTGQSLNATGEYQSTRRLASLPSFLEKAREEVAQEASTVGASADPSKANSDYKPLRDHVAQFDSTVARRSKRGIVVGAILVIALGIAVTIGFERIDALLSPSSTPPYDASHAARLQAYWATRNGAIARFNNKIGMELVLVPPGQYRIPSTQRLSSEPSAPQDIQLTQPYYIGATEVTVKQFREFVNQSQYKTDAEKLGVGMTLDLDLKDFVPRKGASWGKADYPQSDEHPVVHCSVTDAQAFCKWLSEVENTEYRLPTETEWEHACRSGTLTRWSTGDQPGTLVNAGWVYLPGRDYEFFAHAVGKLQPNGFGLFDMHGNVWEWCLTDAAVSAGTRRGSGPSSVVIRGGAFCFAAEDAASAVRRPPNNAENFCTGFRVVRPIAVADRRGAP